MRKLGITFLILALALGGQSCEDWLELIPPDGLVRDEYWTTKEDVEAVLMGAYQKFAQIDERLFLYGELRGDMLDQDVNTPNNQRQIMDGNIYPDNSLCNWQDFYLVINYCNSVLKYIPVVDGLDQTFEDIQQAWFEAEALYLRSLAYFYLIRIYKDVPLVLEASEEDDVEFYLPKSEDTDIIPQLVSDLELAKSKVRDDYGTLEENKGRANKGAILALLADINLWAFNYEEVIDNTGEIENLSDSYLLLPAGKWFENFYPGNSFESIFEFQFNGGLEQFNDLYNLTHYNYKRYKASESAMDRLSPQRSNEIYRGRGSLRYTDGTIWKYVGAAADEKTFRPSSEQSDANWIVYRYADVLLMRAEALSQTGRYDEALFILNQLRNRAAVPQVSPANTPDSFEDVIMEERAIEFAFEGKRWFDLMRLGRRNDYARKSDLIEIIIEKVPSTQKLVLASKLTDPYGWYLPIEEDEIERNSNLKQNPYYESYMSD